MPKLAALEHELAFQRTAYRVPEEPGLIQRAKLHAANREDFLALGKLKTVAKIAGPLGVGQVPVVGPVIKALMQAVVGASAHQRTENVIGVLNSLKGLSADAKDDVAYIVRQKERKKAKVEASGVATTVDTFTGVPIASALVTGKTVLRTVEKTLHETRGLERRDRAERILNGIRKSPADPSYIQVVYALFINRSDAIDMIQSLITSGNRDLCIKVLMGKIASR